MDSEGQPDGGVEPAPDPAGPEPDPGPPLYKMGTTQQRIRSLLDTFGIVAGAFIGANVLILVVVQLLVVSGLATIPPEFSSLTDLPPAVTAVVIATQYVGFFLVGLAYLRWRDGSSPLDTSLYDIRFPSLRDVGWIVGGFVGLLAVLVTITAIASQFGFRPSTNTVETLGRANPPLLLFLALNALVLNGPAEEFLFRGIVQGLFRDAYGVLPGVVLSAAVFGVVHYLALSGGSIAYTLVVITTLGAVLGALYEWSDNLVVPSAVHGLFNAAQFILLYASTTL